MFIGIVADDLTGAADSVAPFAQRGYVAGVGLSVAREAQNPDQQWDALALNTELRDQKVIKPTLIASIARRATRRLIERAPHLYFKKIDSTLRGHLRPELDGMLRELPGRIALICPASPANGRTVENGVLSVLGVPLAHTGFVEGVQESKMFVTVRAAFGFADEPTAVEIGLAVLRNGITGVEAELERHIAGGARTVFCDAVATEDLRTLAEVVLRRSERYLPVGSAGFTRAIAEKAPACPTSSPLWEAARFKRGRILVVVGSRHPMSRQQARRIIDGAGVRPIILERERASGLFVNERDFRERFRAGENLFVIITPEETKASGLHYFVEPLLWEIAGWAKLPNSASPFDGYVVTGGHVAQQVCHALGGRELQILGESEPGIVRAILARHRGLPDVPIILKAGGFGDERTLARCVGLE